jgi:hypothetical protein
MDFRNKRLSMEQAKQIDLVDYLALLGHKSSKVRNNSHWYHSPLHAEKTPSFVVNRNKNVWYDFGLGKGGSIIDFGMLYHKATIPDLLQLLTDGNFVPFLQSSSDPQSKSSEETSKIKIVRESKLSSPSLLSYLQSRSIPVVIAEQHCSEVRFEINSKNYYGIGFQNDSGEYEIRNPYFKSGSSPKDITTLSTGSENIAVFEGFFDFLSYQALQKELRKSATDFLILNSLAFFEKALTSIGPYKRVDLYLDNDQAGRKCTQRAMSVSGKVKDESRLYKGFEDLNDFLLARKNNPSKRRRRGLRAG